MALNLGQIDKVFDPALILPIPARGQIKNYRIEDCPPLLGLYCVRVWATGFDVAQAAKAGEAGDVQAALAALENLNQLPPPPEVADGTPLHIAVLGDTYQQMLDDGVSSRWIEHAGRTTIAWQAGGDDTAKAYWSSAGHPEDIAPNRAARRAASTSTGGASGTRSRGSTSGTTSRRTGSRRRKAGRSGGTNSSPGGT